MDQKYIWAFVKTLRYSEYHLNNHGMWHTIARTYYLWKLRKLAYKTGLQIAPNAVVTKDVEDNVVIGGIPAKVIRRK